MQEIVVKSFVRDGQFIIVMPEPKKESQEFPLHGWRYLEPRS